MKTKTKKQDKIIFVGEIYDPKTRQIESNMSKPPKKIAKGQRDKELKDFLEYLRHKGVVPVRLAPCCPQPVNGQLVVKQKEPFNSIIEGFDLGMEDCVLVNPCFFFGKTTDYTSGTKCTAEHIANLLWTAPSYTGFVFQPEKGKKIAVFQYITGDKNAVEIQFGPLPESLDIHADDNKVFRTVLSGLNDVMVGEMIRFHLINFIKNAYGDDLIVYPLANLREKEAKNE